MVVGRACCIPAMLHICYRCTRSRRYEEKRIKEQGKECGLCQVTPNNRSLTSSRRSGHTKTDVPPGVRPDIRSLLPGKGARPGRHLAAFTWSPRLAAWAPKPSPRLARLASTTRPAWISTSDHTPRRPRPLGDPPASHEARGQLTNPRIRSNHALRQEAHIYDSRDEGRDQRS